MKVALIGGNSFIARSIAQSDVFSSCDIYCCARENNQNAPNYIKFTYPDVDFSFLLDFDVIINCIGVGVQSGNVVSATEMYDSNAFFPIKLIDYLDKNKYQGALVTFGSYFEIGDCSEDKFFDEEMLSSTSLSVPNDYCISKRLLSRFITSKKVDFPLFHLIIPSVYGPSENTNRLIPYTINSIQQGAELEFSEGLQIRQFLHVSDLAQAIYTLIDVLPESGIYNVASSDIYSVRELITIIGDAMGVEIPAECFGRKKTRDTSLKFLKLNGDKLYRLGFKPNIDIKSGILGYIK